MIIILHGELKILNCSKISILDSVSLEAKVSKPTELNKLFITVKSVQAIKYYVHIFKNYCIMIMLAQKILHISVSLYSSSKSK